MVAPRALVFRPLVKGNEDSGNEIVFAIDYCLTVEINLSFEIPPVPGREFSRNSVFMTD